MAAVRFFWQCALSKMGSLFAATPVFSSTETELVFNSGGRIVDLSLSSMRLVSLTKWISKMTEPIIL